MEPDQKRAYLRSCPALESIPGHLLDDLAKCAVELQPGERHLLPREGEIVTHVLLLVSGIFVARRAGRYLARILPVSLVGEMEALTGAVASATVSIEEEPAEVLTVPVEKFREFLKAQPRATEALSRFLAKRLVDVRLRNREIAVEARDFKRRLSAFDRALDRLEAIPTGEHRQRKYQVEMTWDNFAEWARTNNVGFESKDIVQAYLPSNTTNSEIRIRASKGRYELNIARKTNHGGRTKLSAPIKREVFERLLERRIGVVIEKKRVEFEDGGKRWNLDFFAQNETWRGLVLLEVELGMGETADSLTLPTICTTVHDVTELDEYSNRKLAECGAPPSRP